MSELTKMKCFLLLSLVAFSCALPYWGGGKSINISDDGTIVIRTATGKQVVISKVVGPEDQKFIDISVEGPNLPVKKIRIDEIGSDKVVSVQNGPYSGQSEDVAREDDPREKRSPKVATTSKDSKKSKTQADLLYGIFKENEGVADEKSYEALLKKVNDYVDAGDLDSSILDVLQYIHEAKAVQDQTPSETGIAKVPLVHADIASMVRDYIWTNKLQPTLANNMGPEQR